MNPFFFGSSERPLFGIYHPPRAAQSRGCGVLICQPIGQDYMRTHRGMKKLAEQLAISGYPTLRFDYFGTGDSGGESVEASLSGWLDDIAIAVEELKESAQVERVAVVGLRFGALLAHAAVSQRDDLDRLVLWDPVPVGPEYLQSLLQSAEAPGSGFSAGQPIVGVHGFPLTEALQEEIRSFDPYQGGSTSLGGSLLVVSEDKEHYHDIFHRLKEIDSRWTHLVVDMEADWDAAQRAGAVVLPHKMILAIVEYLEQSLNQVRS